MICGAIVLHNPAKPIFIGLPCFFPAAHIIYFSINVGVTMPAQLNYCQIFKILTACFCKKKQISRGRHLNFMWNYLIRSGNSFMLSA